VRGLYPGTFLCANSSMTVERNLSIVLIASLLGIMAIPAPANAAPSTVPLTSESKALSPEAALASMKVPEGYRVEIIAAEPLVMDPVAFDWGSDGRLWVAEMRDYPNGLTWNRPGDPLDAPGGRIKVLTDTNGDGRYDEATIFLDGLSYPTGVKVWGKGILVTAAPEIFYAEDTDGDGMADKREVWYEGFARSNQQHRVNGLAWGLDNWLHVANGDGGGVILSQERREEVDIRGFDLRLNPFTKAHEPLNGRTQCGRFRDDWDNWFGCNNSNPLWHYPYPWQLLKRNPEVRVARAYVDVPREPGASPVYPASPTLERFNDFDRVNRFTSACGPAIYRDVLLGDGVYGNAFVCEPVHNLVSRQVLAANGATFTSDRDPSEKESEFFASTDPWSRPVSVRTGPDGALWVADMYRFVIEHPEWIPQEWQKKLELRAGSERGRIYRVVPNNPASPVIPKLDGLDDTNLVAQLESPNGTVRDLAHQMLLWREAKGAVPPLKEMVGLGKSPLARVHALCVLDGLRELDAATLRLALAGNHAGVVRHAVRLARGRISLTELPGFSDAVLDDAFVAIELSGLVGEIEQENDAAILADLIARHHDDPYAMPSLLSAVSRSNLTRLVAKLTQANPRWQANSVLPDLGRMSAKWQDKLALALLADFLLNEDEPGEVWRMGLLSGLFEGGSTLDELTTDGAIRSRLDARLDAIRGSIADIGLPESYRAAAIRFIGHPAVFTGQNDLDLLVALLVPQSPPLLREAAFEALGRARHSGTPAALMTRWSGFTPADRTKALALLLSRPDWTTDLLGAVESDTIPRIDIDAASRTRLLDSKDPALHERAASLFAGAAASNRDEVVKSHADILTLQGDAVAGKVVFSTLCVACHIAEGLGNPVGPDLSALTDRSPESMLVAILDPNRAVEDKFVNYSLTTTDGSAVYGVIADESANTVTIRQADGSTRPIPRNEIAMMNSSGISLMPEGFEKILTKPQIGDLLAYLTTLGSSAPPAPAGNIDMAARISPGKEGIVELRASKCRLDGERIEYMPDYDAIGWWTSENDRAQWTLVLDRPGTYQVEWDYSVSPDVAGNRWQLEIGGKEVLSGTVTSTGSWETFKTEALGTVELPAADNHVVLRSKGSVRDALLDLRALRFVPVRE
jgi:putative membrane-bound dehydrogenase-like protein